MASLRGGLLAADFFTTAYRMSGHVSTGNRRLSDILSDRLSDFLLLQDIYVSRIYKPGEIVAYYKTGSLIKAQITFVVLPTEADGLSKDHIYPAFTPHLREVFVTVPSFEIRGSLRIVGKLDLQALLAIGTDNFMPLMNATASSSLLPTVQFAGPVILVNKPSVELFCVADKD
ncbi:MAG: hypothetical protein JSV81_12955 [Anaerolineales bacterium]|nr:MAG: hypothetical protein JSV81_12955 [Anaerolineales bacterium]